MSEIELTFAEKKVIKDAVKKNCANYRNFCLPEDGECYMMTIAYRDSPLCRYFQRAVLPASAELMDIFCNEPRGTKECEICKKKFIAIGNRRYCSESCANKAAKMKNASRQKKWREKIR